MPYSVRRTFNRRRRPRSQLQWTEARVARDAAAAVARRAPLVLGPNIAQRGLILNQGEFKSVDLVHDTVSTATGTSVNLLNGIARGDEINERIGREVTMRSIQVKGNCHVTAGTGVDQIHRVMIIYDRQTNAAALTAAQVLVAVGVDQPRNLENRKRFKILFDRSFALNASGKPGSYRTWQFYRRLAHPVTFNAGDAGTVADITTGSLYFVTIGTELAGATAGQTTYSCRIRYTDN